MTKREFEKRFAEEKGIAVKDAKKEIEGFFDFVSKQLRNSDSIEVTGWGTFRRKINPEREARNPKTNESVKVGRRAYASFSPGKKFKANIQP